MDRTGVCGTPNRGSIPLGGTRKEKSKSFGSPRFARAVLAEIDEKRRILKKQP